MPFCWVLQLAAECEASGTRVDSSKSKAIVINREKKADCPLWVRVQSLLKQYPGVLFSSDGRMETEMDILTAASSAVTKVLLWSVDQGQQAKLSIYRSVYIMTFLMVITRWNISGFPMEIFCLRWRMLLGR